MKEAPATNAAQPSQLTRGKGLRASRCRASGLRIATTISLDSVLRNQVLSLSVASCVATAKTTGPGDSRPRPPAPRRGGGPNAGRRKAPVPAGHYKSSPGDKPLASKNGAAEFTRRAVARALQEGTRARTSGGAARRGSDVGGRQPDPGSPRLPDVRARRLLTQWSRRADADNASGCRFRTRSGTSRTRRAPCSSRRAGCCSSRPGSWYRCRIPDRPGPCRRCNPWSGCPVPPWCPCR